MESDQAVLDVRAGPHLLRAPKEHSDLPASDPVEEGLFLEIRIGIADDGDFGTGDAAGFEFLNDFLVGGVTPEGGCDAHIAENHLGTASFGRTAPDGGDGL